MKAIHMIILVMGLGLVACGGSDTSDQENTISSEESEVKSKAQQVVDRAIAVAGGELYNSCDIEFDFRERHYRCLRDNGLYTYERLFSEEGDEIRDVVNNEGFTRYVNGTAVDLPDSTANSYASSVNSVIYFVLIPQPLNDPAVIKEYAGEIEIEGQPYHKVRVTFEQRGGGEDYTDIYMYWIHQEDFTVDYFAYRYYVEGGGLRFRDAYNPRVVNGIRFVDYINYKYDDLSQEVGGLDQLFMQEQLEELSIIEQENIEVEILDQDS